MMTIGALEYALPVVPTIMTAAIMYLSYNSKIIPMVFLYVLEFIEWRNYRAGLYINFSSKEMEEIIMDVKKNQIRSIEQRRLKERLK